jgi:hypothetical protein
MHCCDWRRFSLRIGVLGVTGIAAAAGLTAGVLVIPSGPHSAAGVAAGSGGTTQTAQLTAGQQTLYGLSAAAAGIHRRPAGTWSSPRSR